MSAVRRSIFFTVLAVAVGTVVALVPGGSVSVAQSCEGDFAKRLRCWAERIVPHGHVVVTLDEQLSYDGGSEQDRKTIEKDLRKRRDQLVVQVPAGVRTGEGGTALLVLAGGRLVDPGATVDRLPDWALGELAEAGACTPKRLCDMLALTDKEKQPLTGEELIKAQVAVDRSTHVDAIGPIAGPTVTVPPGTSDPGGQRSDGKDGNAQGAHRENDDGRATGGEDSSGLDSTSWAILFMSVLLVLLLAAMVTLVRRSRGPVAVGHRAPRATGVGTAPTGSAGRSGRTTTRSAHAEQAMRSAHAEQPTRSAHADQPTRSAHADQPTRSSPTEPSTRSAPTERTARSASTKRTAPTERPARSGQADEATTRLRVGPARRYGRQVGNRAGPARTAVVRTELHPQGYVELDRVLYRAVWAEPGRPPPAPGGLVDVTDAHERDSDVLYAFRPAGGRHAAKGPR